MSEMIIKRVKIFSEKNNYKVFLDGKFISTLKYGEEQNHTIDNGSHELVL